MQKFIRIELKVTMSEPRFLLIMYPVQGHINPAFQLAKRLISFGADVTITTTLHMHRRITNKPTHPRLSFLPFSDGYDDGYTSKDHSVYSYEFKRRGSQFLTNLILQNAQEGHPFTCLVYTTLLSWASEVGRQLHLPTALFWTQPATVLNIFYYYFHGYGEYIDANTKDPSSSSSSSSIQLPGLPFLLDPRDIPSFLLGSNPSIDSIVVPLFEKQFLDLDVEEKPTVLVNTFQALEPEALRSMDKLNMIPMGPLIPSAFLDGKDPSDTSFGGDIFRVSNGCREWLDSKPEKSVVYVSFGSLCVLSKTEMEELAGALLECASPFLWVIREKETWDELSCMEELEQKGKIVTWCSQVEVLSHPSVGCFVTHCGWNSTMESLASGVPMVAFPRWVEQKTNAMLIQDVWKTGVRVDNEVNEEGVVEREGITRCLKMVMGDGDKGEGIRNNAKKWKNLAREAVKEGGSSSINLTTFLDHLPQLGSAPS